MHPPQSRKGNLLLSVMGASAQYKRELFRDRQREGIELAANLSKRSIAGEGKSALAREFGVDRHTIYRYEARGTNAKIKTVRSGGGREARSLQCDRRVRCVRGDHRRRALRPVLWHVRSQVRIYNALR